MKMSQTGDEQYRFTLTRDWGTGTGRACWIMLNPSTADGTKDDPTLKRIIKFSQSWGYGSLVVVNLYPFRTSKPAECRKLADCEASGPDANENMCADRVIVWGETSRSDLVIAAWGSANWGVWHEDHIDDLIHLLSNGEGSRPLYTLVKDKPIHPLARGKHRVPDTATPVLWREGSK